MREDSVRWLIGGVIAIAAFVLVWQNSAQSRVDEIQTESIRSLEINSRQYQEQMQETFRELTVSQFDTAKILEGVASRIEAIDERGSRALVHHERSRHRDGGN
tara:strand:- start:355 stop:663 length:309 start_codon:yes stop_codon:yes gene_type:complete